MDSTERWWHQITALETKSSGTRLGIKTIVIDHQVALVQDCKVSKLRQDDCAMQTVVRKRLQSFFNLSTEAQLRNDIKLFAKTIERDTFCNLTVNYSCSKLTARLLGNYGLVILFSVTPSSAVQGSSSFSRYQTKRTVANIPLLRLEAQLSSLTSPRTGAVAQERPFRKPQWYFSWTLRAMRNSAVHHIDTSARRLVKLFSFGSPHWVLKLLGWVRESF